MQVVRFVSAAQMGPAGLNFCAADFLGGVLICIDRVNCFLNFCILVTGLSAKQARYDGRSV